LFREALRSFESASAIFNEIEDLSGRSNVLYSLGEAYRKLGLVERAVEYFQQSLSISRYLKDLSREANILNSLSETYITLGRAQKAIEYSNQALAIFVQIKDRQGEGNSLNNLSSAYKALGQYQKAIEYSNQALAIFVQIKDRQGEGNSLDNLSSAYKALGQYQKAIEYSNRALAIFVQIEKESLAVVNSLNNLSSAYKNLGQYQKVIDYSKQAVTLAEKIGYQNGLGTAINNWGYALEQLGQGREAIRKYENSIAIQKSIRVRPELVVAFGNLGRVFARDGKYDVAIGFYKRSLEISRQINDRTGEAYALSNLGYLFDRQKPNDTLVDRFSKQKYPDPEIAIIFYKQAINVTESIRKDIRGLPGEEQKSYLLTVESTYRNLADLLLKQDRILEAQQVLDLLKVEELNEYLRTPTRSSQTEQGTELRNQEKNFIALALELDELQKRNRANNITASEQERLNQLAQSEREQIKQFTAFLNSPIVQKLVDELRRNEEQQNLDTKNFRNIREDILAQHPNAVLLYPLILEDRLELILITAKTTPIRRTINIKREKLNQEIVDFLTKLRDPSSQDIKVPAQQLYTWLIKPFETELAELKIDTILYAPDGQLRYIPLAALHDGKQWLVEKYRVNNITATSLTKFNKPPIATPKIFAGAFGNVNKQGFTGLPATLTEVKKIADRFPNTTTFIETAFTKNVTENNSNSYTVLHLATHGQLSSASDKPEDSFILFGDGTKATIADIQGWNLKNVDLVILSACQSGLGSKLGNGVEILGLGYQMQAAGARMSIASLWKVSDAGTEKLMDAFYTAVKTGKVSNVEALRQAQVAMITDNYEDLGETRSLVSIEVRPRSTSSTAPAKISHPYYWAAFILIGNGL
jgi:CHAT domain-containing protein